MIDEKPLIEYLSHVKEDLSQKLINSNEYLTGNHVSYLFDKIIEKIDSYSKSNNIDDFKYPNTCGECCHIGKYETGPFARNPHCCCELIYTLIDEDYKVDKNSRDENCPLKEFEQCKSRILNTYKFS